MLRNKHATPYYLVAGGEPKVRHRRDLKQTNLGPKSHTGIERNIRIISTKMNQKPRSKQSVRLKPTGSQDLGWSLGGDVGESSRADFSTNVSGFQLLLGTWGGCSDAIFNECFTF